MVATPGGSDALFVDMQHAPYSIETTAMICAATLGIGIAPLVRAPNHDAQWMSRVLDGVRNESSFRMSTPTPGRSDRQRIRLSTNGRTLGDGIGAGARLPRGELNPKLNAVTAVIAAQDAGS
jgi:hypothetical protein